jgi:hypothetical protein
MLQPFEQHIAFKDMSWGVYLTNMLLFTRYIVKIKVLLELTEIFGRNLYRGALYGDIGEEFWRIT